MTALQAVYGVPLAAIPEPLRSALQAVLEREWTGDPATYQPSALACALLDETATWLYAARRAGRWP
jgi:hypothetical protein